MKVTAKQFDYCAAPYGRIAYIPAGIAVEPATNLPPRPDGVAQYWIAPWEGMSEQAESWHRNYGFIATAIDLAESPFCVGQRVRILPCPHYPGKVRYGIIQGATRCPGMCLVNEDRTSNDGEWAYIVASYKSPKAGALWFSAKGLEPMKRPAKK